MIFSFLNEQSLDDREYYDIAALGYLSATRRYLAQPKLQRYAFSTVAWKSMRRSVAAFRRAETLRTQTEQRYLETVRRTDPEEELEVRSCLHDLTSTASRSQYELLVLRLQGFSVREAARRSVMTPKRARRLLQELHQLCFQSTLH